MFEFEYTVLHHFAVNADKLAMDFHFERSGAGSEDADDVARLKVKLGEVFGYGAPVGLKLCYGLKLAVDVFLDDNLLKISS